MNSANKALLRNLFLCKYNIFCVIINDCNFALFYGLNFYYYTLFYWMIASCHENVVEYSNYSLHLHFLDISLDRLLFSLLLLFLFIIIKIFVL